MPEAPNLPSPIDFFAHLKWLDGKPLLDTIEPYRRELFMRALHEFNKDGTPRFNLVLAGRAKKNWKSADLILAGLYKLLISEAPQGSDVLLVANDEGQAGDDLDLAKKIVRRNRVLGAELDIQQKAIKRKDGRGTMKILPSRDAAGAHGKTATLVGFDEIHAFRDWDLLEALQPDPLRWDAQVWITSYDTVYSHVGTPLYDLKAIGMAGTDPRMLFSWYSGELCTDPAFAELEPEFRANPSINSWPEGSAYLEQQRRRLPAFKFRRLHLNLPGALSGAFLDPDSVLEAIVVRRKSLPPMRGTTYAGFVDMSGGSSDDACLAIAHKDEAGKVIVDLVEKQAGGVPFNPRDAVRKFAGILRAYGLARVTGDAYGGETFKLDFQAAGISYLPCKISKSVLYEQFEPRLNAGELELPNVPKLQEQLLGLVYRGVRVDHAPNEHDDFANACAGASWVATVRKPVMRVGYGGPGGYIGVGGNRGQKITWRDAVEPERTHVRFLRVDEAGRELTPEQSQAIRHSLPGRRPR